MDLAADDLDNETLTVAPPPEIRSAWLTRVRSMSDVELFTPRISMGVHTYRRIREGFPNAKVLYFSKFPKLLDLLEEAICREMNILPLRFDGTKSDQERASI